jgi:hypothetical protein
MLHSRLVAAVAIIFSTAAMAQVSTGGIPYGLRAGLSLEGVPTVQAAPFDAQVAAEEDARRDAASMPPKYASVLAVDAGLTDAGLWTLRPDGGRIWRLRVSSTGALATELFFSDVFLPNGASLYVYDGTGEQVLGGFTSYNDRPSGLFATGEIMGASSIVEYDEPAAVMGQGHLRIASVGHAYRLVGDALSDPCEVDVNCSEGDGWQAQRDGVVRISVKIGNGLFLCSGSLVNNLTQDCKPYFLTANHCTHDEIHNINASADDFEQWKFYFKYQRQTCGSGGASLGKLLTGCTKRGDSHDNGGDSGSDFVLLEAESATIPDDFDPYWNGWDASGTGSTGGVGIHHPAGSVKKISTYTVTTASSTWFTVPNTHWRITWAGTANGHGVTEGGSSGSPLFNNAHRIIGTLTGGSSACDGGLTSPDWYGKMSYHWQSDGGTANEKLKHWLDPENTGILSMDGSYGPCGHLGVDEEDVPIDAPTLFPNPASDKVTVEYPEGMHIVDRIEVLDLSGRMVLSVMPRGSDRTELDVRGWEAGLYLVRMVVGGTRIGVAPLTVARP